jgi:hypothetical protein
MVFHDEQKHHTFVVENVGEAPVVITRIQTTCGCVAVDSPSSPIAPNSESTIKVRFDAKKTRGRQRKTIYVYSNDPRNQAIALDVQATVRAAIWIEPSDRIDLGEIGKRTSIPDRKITVKWREGSGGELLDVRTTAGISVVERRVAEDSNEPAIELTLRFSAAELVSTSVRGRISERVILETRGEQNREVRVYVLGKANDC